MEIAHPEPHPVIIFHDVISTSESDGLIDQALPKINRAFVGADKKRSEMRVSKNTWLPDDNDVVTKVSLRINWITGLNTFLKSDHGRMDRKEEFEFLQVVLKVSFSLNKFASFQVNF